MMLGEANIEHRTSNVERRMQRPLFEENASATLARVQRIFRERGEEYGDTWRHSQYLILRAVYKEIFGEALESRFCAALAAAVLCDVKYQRNEGGYNQDSLDDGINYMAFLAEEMRKIASEGWPEASRPDARTMPSVPACGRSV
jgi:hypothetical protein